MDSALLFKAFHDKYFDEFFESIKAVLRSADPTIAVLALEGLYRINKDRCKNEFPKCLDDAASNILRKWRNESLSFGECPDTKVNKTVPDILKSLTIFKTLQVPLFVDDYGKKILLSTYGDETQNIVINENTEIAHVTHSEEAKSIEEVQKLKGSDRKNIVEGCWFGLWNAQNPKSVYGSKAFKTTLKKLGVSGLDQGEIVQYKNELNVILYAKNDVGFDDLKKPTDQTVKSTNQDAYVKVSIFVPSEFLTKNGFNFMEVFEGPIEVPHRGFCVSEKRGYRKKCTELNATGLEGLFKECLLDKTN